MNRNGVEVLKANDRALRRRISKVSLSAGSAYVHGIGGREPIDGEDRCSANSQERRVQMEAVMSMGRVWFGAGAHLGAV